MTSYLLEKTDPRMTRSIADVNSFMPPCEHYFDGIHSSAYVDMEYKNADGSVEIRQYDVVRRRFVDAATKTGQHG